ncbi:MAG: ribose transport system permease protein [Thermoleophilaceae bacterium]|jgi:ribose transport system permease protein|nr:ribose transport system permease protein [Thermoleophilaceae bacterium]
MLGRLTQSNAGGLVLLTAVSWFVYQAVGEGFLSSFNLFTLSQLAAQTAVIGFAQLVVIAIGRLNLAVGAVGLSVVMFTGWLVETVGVSPVLAVLAGLVLGAAMGAFMGWVELRTGLHSFIVTLAIQSVYIGIVLIVSNGVSVTTLPSGITDFGSKWLFVPELSLLVVPAVAIAAALLYLFRRSSFGWKMLAVGANEPAAELSGVRVSRVVIGSFALSGLLAGVAGVMEMSRVAAALPSMGTDWLLPAFIVPILGGAFLTGGFVSISGAVMAAIFLESIAAGLVSLNVATYWQAFAEAIVLLVAVVADQARRRRRQRIKTGGVLRAEVRRAEHDERAYA